ncbi:histidine phosphatase family protein [Brevibacterium sp. 5221]|uniref:Histidine phosphatase family protein n=1 Tax=Brevibacterium rongguiense TaxID=2695267 RepID=A0A6N9H7I2_9MICO|nr:histidine phosphatase family protein [Brevibacterium rongguiense]MYM19909.1 histidine phosphatase family protein [Brevibacterium rongguiense]
MTRTRVHLTRHGEVDNPEGILYGRLPGYGLSERGGRMAQRLGEHYAAAQETGGAAIRGLVRSPLQRTAETIAPTAAALDLEPVVDERVIEAGNGFEGMRVDRRTLLEPARLAMVYNPLRPSWGEAYRAQALRMTAAIASLRRRLEDAAAAEGLESADGIIVSHQLPIWMARRFAEGRRLWHDPRARECALGSVTTLTYDGGTLVGVDYRDVCADLQPARAGVGA